MLLAFTQAVYVYPWYLTVLNVGMALSLTAYLVRVGGWVDEHRTLPFLLFLSRTMTPTTHTRLILSSLSLLLLLLLFIPNRPPT